jgi:hypothetical protein
MARHFAFERLSDAAKKLAIPLYEDGATLDEVMAAIKEETGEEIGASSLHRYFSKVVAVERQSRQAIKRRIQAMIDATREDPACTEGEILKALSYEAALAKRDEADQLDLGFLIQEQRRREEAQGRMQIEKAKIEIDRERNQIERDKLQVKRETAIEAQKAISAIEPGKLAAASGDPAQLKAIVEAAIAERLGLTL